MLSADFFKELVTAITYVGGTGGAGLLGWKAIKWFLNRQDLGNAGAEAATAASMSTTAAIERLERHLERAEKRAEEATARADKAERERNDALNKISQMEYAINRLTQQVADSHAETLRLRQELEQYAAKH